jgi:hypothetical protein
LWRTVVRTVPLGGALRLKILLTVCKVTEVAAGTPGVLGEVPALYSLVATRSPLPWASLRQRPLQNSRDTFGTGLSAP